MSVTTPPINFYESATQILAILLLAETARAAILARSMPELNEVTDDAKSNLERLDGIDAKRETNLQNAERVLADLEALEPPSDETKQMRAEQIASARAVIDEIEADRAESADIRVGVLESLWNVEKVSRRMRRGNAAQAIWFAFVVVIEVVGLAVAIAVLAEPDRNGQWTFTLVIWGLTAGLAGVVHQVLHPLLSTIEWKHGWGSRFALILMFATLLVPALLFILYVD